MACLGYPQFRAFEPVVHCLLKTQRQSAHLETDMVRRVIDTFYLEPLEREKPTTNISLKKPTNNITRTRMDQNHKDTAHPKPAAQISALCHDYTPFRLQHLKTSIRRLPFPFRIRLTFSNISTSHLPIQTKSVSTNLSTPRHTFLLHPLNLPHSLHHPPIYLSPPTFPYVPFIALQPRPLFNRGLGSKTYSHRNQSSDPHLCR